MSMFKEMFDVKQHPQRDGTVTDLEKRVQSIERRFAEIYRREQIGEFSGFCTEQGTKFYVNGVYEWGTVFLEYEDGEDGDMISLEYEEDVMFQKFQDEILVGELDDRMNLENTYRIFKTEIIGDRTSIYFRFPDGKNGLMDLFEKNTKITIDGTTYEFEGIPDYQSVIVHVVIDKELYDHWIRFEE